MANGMRRVLLTSVVFAAATALNTGSVALQQRHAVLTRRFGERGWYVHLALVLPAWGVFLSHLRGLNARVRWPLPPLVRPLGLPVLGTAVALWLLAYRQLGGARTANGNIFGHGPTSRLEGGLFRFVDNPMYLSYVLAFVGLALRRTNAVYLVLAVESYLLCYQVEARAENRLLPDRQRRAGDGRDAGDAVPSRR